MRNILDPKKRSLPSRQDLRKYLESTGGISSRAGTEIAKVYLLELAALALPFCVCNSYAAIIARVIAVQGH